MLLLLATSHTSDAIKMQEKAREMRRANKVTNTMAETDKIEETFNRIMSQARHRSGSSSHSSKRSGSSPRKSSRGSSRSKCEDNGDCKGKTKTKCCKGKCINPDEKLCEGCDINAD